MIYAGAIAISRIVAVFDDGGGAVLNLVAATFPAEKVYNGITNVAMPPLSNLASATAPWVAGGVFEIGGGRYRRDYPDAAFATADTVTIWAEEAGKHVFLTIEVQPLAIDVSEDDVKAILTDTRTG